MEEKDINIEEQLQNEECSEEVEDTQDESLPRKLMTILPKQQKNRLTTKLLSLRRLKSCVTNTCVR